MNAYLYGGFDSLDVERPRPANAWPSLVFAVLAVGAFVLALVMREGMVNVIMAFAGAVLAFFAWAGPRLMTDVRYRHVRVAAYDDRLTFVPTRLIERLDNTVMALLVTFWLLIVSLWFIPGESDAAASPVAVVALIAVPVVVAYSVWQLTHPRGLTLTPDGIRGVRRGPKVAIAWDDIEDVTVSELPGRGRIVVSRRGAKPVHIDSTRVGSDARVVAHVIEHYRLDARRRADLTQGPRLLARFGGKVTELP